tara:strand:- start:1630 stop:1971 length:342 start_codon:yes stop_codon:yes gene_type:complete
MIVLTLFSLIICGVMKALADLTEEGVLVPSKHDSWRNKWKDGNKANGEEFPFSSTALVFLTDNWHFFNGIRSLGYIIAILTYRELFNAPVDGILLFGTYSLGFNVTYEFIKRG